MVIEGLIYWYETYISLLKEAFRQAEADKAAIREWTKEHQDEDKKPERD